MEISDIDSVVENAISISKNRFELWVYLTKKLGCNSFCEVGVWTGAFAKILLQNNENILDYTLIDPWRNLPNWNKPMNISNIKFEEVFKEAMDSVSSFKDKVVVIRDTTKNAKDKIADNSLDFVYIDGDHTLRGITIDLNSMLAKVRKNGFIGGDDFTKTIWQHGNEFSPTEVFPYALHFAEAHDLRIYTLPFNQFLILNSPDGFKVIDHGKYADLTPEQIYIPSNIN